VDYWPGIEGNTDIDSPNTTYSTVGVTEAAGIVRHGGKYDATLIVAQVSDRSDAINYTGLDVHDATNGGRLVRSAP
jgi:hypothetical protein